MSKKPSDQQRPTHRPPPPLKQDGGLGEPQFDDRPQHEDEVLSDLLQRSSPEDRPSADPGKKDTPKQAGPVDAPESSRPGSTADKSNEGSPDKPQK